MPGSIQVKRYIRRRHHFTKEERLKGMMASLRSRKTPAALKKGLRRKLEREGVL